jgi:tetratricopeptide (TPR) repeat protein
MTRKTNSSKSRALDNSRSNPLISGIEFRTDLSETDFEIQFHEAILRGSPNYVDVLRRLGHLLTGHGQYMRGLEMDQRLVALRPDDPVARYNLACSLALTARCAESIAELRKAIELGYDDFAHMEVDDDLDNLRGNAEFQAILKGAPCLDR